MYLKIAPHNAQHATVPHSEPPDPLSFSLPSPILLPLSAIYLLGVNSGKTLLVARARAIPEICLY